MISCGELDRMRMGFPVDAARERRPVDEASSSHEDPSTNAHEEAHELAVEFLANTLNMPGDNRVPINRILQRAHDNPNPNTRMELVNTLHNMLSEDECVGFAERARKGGADILERMRT